MEISLSLHWSWRIDWLSNPIKTVEAISYPRPDLDDLSSGSEIQYKFIYIFPTKDAS